MQTLIIRKTGTVQLNIMYKVALTQPDHPGSTPLPMWPIPSLEEVSAGRAQDPALSPVAGSDQNTRARGCRGPGNHVGRLQEVHPQKRGWSAPDSGHPLARYLS